MQLETFKKNLLVLSLAIIPFASTVYAKNFDSEEFKLSNGMDVVVIPNTKVPAVSHMVWYKTGAMDDPLGKSGLAHFLEHLMFKGTTNHPTGQFSKYISKSGGTDNAFTGKDFTGYYQNVSKEKLELMMQLESDRMKNLKFDSKEVQLERSVVLEERNARTENHPSALLTEQMKAALFLNHPYRRPIIGWQHEIRDLSLNDAKTFYKKHYAPNNAILVVSGDISKIELQPLAEKYYGTIPKQKIAKRVSPKEPEPRSPRVVKLNDSRATTPEWSRYYLAPNYNNERHWESFALIILSHVLGDSGTSRLYQNLVVNSELAASVGSYYDELSVGPSIFALHAIPVDKHSLSSVEKTIDQEILRIIEDGITNDELKRSKQRLISDTIYAQEDLKTLAYIYGKAMIVGAGKEYVENWQKNIKAVTQKQVQAVATKYLIPNRSVTGYLQDGVE